MKLKTFFKKTKKYIEVNKKNAYLYIVAGIFIVTGVVAGLAYSFALPEEVKEVVIDSDNYGDPGSYRVKKSASWIDSDTAKIRFDFDSVMKIDSNHFDVIMVFDVSGSMNQKLDKVKSDTIEFVNSVLENSDNRISLIGFDTTSSILSDFTNDKQTILDAIHRLSTNYGITNYYDALINVDSILKNYEKKEDKDLVLLFLTDGNPNEKVPNEVGQY